MPRAQGRGRVGEALARAPPEALRAPSAMLDVASGAEIAEATGLSRAAVAAAKKRVRRYG